MHQSNPQAPAGRALFRTVLCTVAAVVLLALLPLGAGVALPPIEGFPHYQPQSRCNPKPKPGTVMLATYLMRHYRGSGSLGISRSCRAGGVSEHKEGRAFDWALSARSRRDRHYAANFIHRLRKRDRFGRRDALARRMGVMYVIWNDHIYSASSHYKKRHYLNAGCRRIKSCSTTLRHRDHMHISLTRAAAAERTSWYRAHGARKVGHTRHHRRHHVSHHRRHRAHHHAHHRRHHGRHHVKHNRAHHQAHHRRHHGRHHVKHHRAHHRHHGRHRRHHRGHHRGRASAQAVVTELDLVRRRYDGQGPVTGQSEAATEDWSNLVDSSEDAVGPAQAP